MSSVYRYEFAPEVSLDDVEITLVLSIFAVEALHGEAQVRLDVGHAFDRETRRCAVDASTPAGQDFNRLLAGFLQREFGPDAFKVERQWKSAPEAAVPV